jgi:hypothetical protein
MVVSQRVAPAGSPRTVAPTHLPDVEVELDPGGYLGFRRVDQPPRLVGPAEDEQRDREVPPQQHPHRGAVQAGLVERVPERGGGRRRFGGLKGSTWRIGVPPAMLWRQA